MLTKCNVCQSDNIVSIWELPKFPLTGVYLENSSNPDFDSTFDQELQFCESCTHSQLRNQIDPIFLYRETYTHRTSESPISTSGNQFLLNFINRELPNSDFKQALEIGCNDLFLLENIDNKIEQKSGIDPIWSDGLTVTESEIRLWGGFVETTEYKDLLKSKVDLIISAHTFEHVNSPRVAMDLLNSNIADNCLLFIEVPSAERMLDQVRLDQVFNQHVNYYSVNSLINLFEPYGFTLEKVEYNYSYWGGTQILKFGKGSYSTGGSSPVDFVSKSSYSEAISKFTDSISVTKSQILRSHGNVFAFGAAQMLPVLAYHLGEDFELLAGIYDDNQLRQGKYFPNINLQISRVDRNSNLVDQNILITALDSTRPILNRILPLKPRSIILPLGIF